MKTLMIVEDEKMIRKGIATMAQRSSVPIDEILECRNGLEALELLQTHSVDVIFTDIRMPKMDGIELVKRISTMEISPLIVVVSGYDDFNYAVEMMKQGVLDYLLKPVKREKVDEVLKKLEQLIEERQARKKEEIQSFQDQLSYVLLSEQVQEDDWCRLERRAQEIVQFGTNDSYVLAVGNQPISKPSSELGWIVLEDINQQMVILIRKASKESWMAQLDEGVCLGYSKVHSNLRELCSAYGEAIDAREEAFVRGIPSFDWQPDMYDWKDSLSLSGFEEQFIHQFTTEKLEQAIGKLKNIFFMAKHQPHNAKRLVKLVSDIQTNLEQNYARMISEEMKTMTVCQPPLYYPNADVYLIYLEEWIRQLKLCITEQFDTNQNRAKIKEAIDFIKKNYQKDLNMAMVSNHVSMNYSLFSIAFKEYTGVNFVNYLKQIRIDEAKRLLETTDEKIIDISYQVGYENEKHFMKTFKNICGVSPSEYRKGVLISNRNV